MRGHYDIEKLDPRPNPYVRNTKKQTTINISVSAIEYFKEMAAETGIPYQTLMNLYLTDCADRKLKLNMVWGERPEYL